jgi:hypothetical protein
MTTRDFITKAFNGETKATKCSSVFVDGNKDIYSYGYHYPLIFRVGNKVIRNTRGYSSTTDRHISWSRDIKDAIDIHTLRGFRLIGTNDEIISQLIRGQEQYIESLQAEMDTKKRKDTKVFEWLQYKYDRAVLNLKKVQA